MRAFIALEIPPGTRALVADLTASLKPKVPGVRFLSPETVHLTLRFLGETSDEQVQALRPRLAAATAACPATDVYLAGLGTFPAHGRPHVLWLGLQMPEPLLALQRACEDAAVAGGFTRETRPFRSHVTLGRWRDAARRPDLPPADLGRVRLESLVLYESRLHPNGAIHTPLATFPLRG